MTDPASTQSICNPTACLRQQARTQALLENLTEKVDETHTAIIGSPGSTGLIVRVDRLEQDNQRTRRHGNVIFASSVGALFSAILAGVAALFAHKGP